MPLSVVNIVLLTKKYSLKFLEMFLKLMFINLLFAVAVVEKCFVSAASVFETLDNFTKALSQVDLSLTTTEIVKQYGYPTEVHNIVTEDGYILETYRVPYGKKSTTKEPNKYPVILHHGLLGSSENFIVGGPKKSLTYVLADKGYDVWLMNARGTWHSRKHTTLNPDTDKAFWKFTWHEIGIYDTANTIDYVLNITNTQKVAYVGHSQGTTSFFVMCSERPEYCDKVSILIGMAPSALLAHIKEPFVRIAAGMYPYLLRFAESMGIYELIPKQLFSNEALRQLGKGLCGEKGTFSKGMCNSILTVSTLDDQIDPETIPFIMAMGFGGASVYQAFHYAQIIKNAKFMQYDWGAKENMKRYHSKVPPEYNLKNVTCPVVLMYGPGDVITTEEDIIQLAQILPNVVEVYKVPYDRWTHMDFVWGKDLNKYVLRHLVNILNKFTKEAR